MIIENIYSSIFKSVNHSIDHKNPTAYNVFLDRHDKFSNVVDEMKNHNIDKKLTNYNVILNIPDDFSDAISELEDPAIDFDNLIPFDAQTRLTFLDHLLVKNLEGNDLRKYDRFVEEWSYRHHRTPKFIGKMKQIADSPQLDLNRSEISRFALENTRKDLLMEEFARSTYDEFKNEQLLNVLISPYLIKLLDPILRMGMSVHGNFIFYAVVITKACLKLLPYISASVIMHFSESNDRVEIFKEDLRKRIQQYKLYKYLNFYKTKLVTFTTTYKNPLVAGGLLGFGATIIAYNREVKMTIYKGATGISNQLNGLGRTILRKLSAAFYTAFKIEPVKVALGKIYRSTLTEIAKITGGRR